MNYAQAVLKAKMNDRRRRKRVIDSRKIPTTEERIRKVRKKGGFDTSFIDKESMKLLEDTHTCFWCKKRQKPIIDEVATKGRIIMTCDTDECPVNYAEKRSSWNRTTKKLFAEHIDRKLMFDLRHIMATRDPSRLWATRKGTI